MNGDGLEFFGEIELGLDAQQFFQGKLGQEILRRSQEQVLNAFEKWKRSDPNDAKHQRELQNEVKVAERFPQWIGELITKGRTAEELLTQDRE